MCFFSAPKPPPVEKPQVRHQAVRNNPSALDPSELMRRRMVDMSRVAGGTIRTVGSGPSRPAITQSEIGR